MDQDYKIGDRVLVSATCTGFGRDIRGVIVSKEEFLRETYYDIDYLETAPYGTTGISVIGNTHIKPFRK